MKKYKTQNPQKILEKTLKGNFTFNHEISRCRFLTDDFKCKEWKNDKRPKVCVDFPIFLVKNYVIFSSFCPAVNDGLFEDYIKKIK